MNISRIRNSRCLFGIVVAGYCTASFVNAADIFKANNNDNLDLTTSWWTTATGPENPSTIATNDVLWFGNGMGADRTVALGSDLSVGQIRLDNNSGSPNYSATISAGNTLTLNGPTGLLQNSGTGGSLTVDCDVVAATAQSWITSRSLAVGGNVDIGANQILVNTASTNGVFTITGQITGSRASGQNAFLLSPTSLSGGRLILTNASNSFTGNIEFTTSLSSGLEFAAAGALGANTTTQQIRFRNTGGTAGNGSFLRYTGTTDEIVSKTLQCDTSIGIRLESNSVGGSVTFNGAFSQSNRPLYLGGTGIGDNTLAIAFAGNGAITKRDAGKWVLTATNTNSGGVVVSGGTLEVGSGGTAGSITGNASLSNGATLAFNRSDDLVYAGVISGAGGVDHNGAGRLTLTGANTYTGLTTVSSGTLTYTGNASLGSNLSGASPTTVEFAANTLTIGNTTAGDSLATFAGLLDGSGALNLRGGSASVVDNSTGAAGANGNAFILAVTTANVPATAFALDTGSSTSDRKDFAYTNNSGDVLTLSSLSGFGAIRNDSGTSNVVRFITVDQASDTTYDGAITSHLSSGGVTRELTLQKQGLGRLTLAGFVGKQTLGGGTGAAAVNLTANGGVLEVTNAENTTTANTDARYSGIVTITSGTLAFSDQALINTAGTAGATSILMNGGTLRWNAGTTQDMTAGSRLSFVPGTTATFDTNGNDVTLGSFFGGDGTGSGLVKAGTGTLTLGASSDLSGATTVSAGTLLVNAGLTATSGVTINAGATFGGSGSVNAVISGAGLVSPGNSPGITTATGVDPSGGTAYAFEFTATGSPTYSDSTASVNDVLRLTDGTTPFVASLSGGNVVDVYFDVATLTGGDSFKGGFYTDLQADFLASVENGSYSYWVRGDGTGTDRTFNGQGYFSLSNFDAALSVTLSTVAETANFASGSVNGQVMEFAVVPEPGTLVLAAAGLGLAGLQLARRRRRSEAIRCVNSHAAGC